ncbi:MAG TPA: trehalose-6-phosphate synthase [Acidimicrobiales bacterium]|nr:trehalose-6-phosphate synthase [Acidimicrobiales bacterium]
MASEVGQDIAEEATRDPLVLVSNRGPVEHTRTDGERKAERGHGGLVTALAGLATHVEGAVWVCAALSEEDVAVAREHDGGAFDVEEGDGPGLRIRMLELDPEAQHKFYAVISNPLLWFIQHYLWDLSDEPDITHRETDAFDNGYAPVNAQFADAVAEEVEALGGRATVMLQDYHFYLVAERVRERCPEAFLHHFVHIPWPHPDAWRILPPGMREALFNGLLGNDVVAFHTRRSARNFLLTCQELLDLRVDLDRHTVEVGDRTVVTRWHPISVNPEDLEAKAASEAVADHERRLAEKRREHLILRVDRADLSKNILRGFRAFDTMLDDHPELAERVTFLALLQPSREDVEQYTAYLEKVRRLVADVNLKHGTDDWQPIDLDLEGDFDQVVAAYKLFDVLVVNAVFDGMNLVAKESVLVNERDGVLALSENTGAFEELGKFAVTLHPFDIQQQADALFAALTMDAQDRRDRMKASAAVVRENDIAKWLREQLDDVRRFSRETDRR